MARISSIKLEDRLNSSELSKRITYYVTQQSILKHVLASAEEEISFKTDTYMADGLLYNNDEECCDYMDFMFDLWDDEDYTRATNICLNFYDKKEIQTIHMQYAIYDRKKESLLAKALTNPYSTVSAAVISVDHNYMDRIFCNYYILYRVDGTVNTFSVPIGCDEFFPAHYWSNNNNEL